MKFILFGRGVGESMLCNYNDDQWLIVDSCYGREAGKKNPATLEYLKDNEIPFDNVKLIIISHFHDDHIKGMSDVINSCPQAEIYIPDALATKEFVRYITTIADVNDSTQDQQGVSEIYSIFQMVKGAGRTINRVKADQVIFRDVVKNIQIAALSPSQEECDDCLAFFLKQIETLAKSEVLTLPSSLPHQNINNNCITIHISSNQKNDIFLGADLENNASEKKGWGALVKAKMFVNNTSSVFKISHHGSENGFSKGSWDKIVVDHKKPIGVLTPYSKQSLPRKDMIDLYLEHTSELYSTSPVKEHAASTEVKKILSLKDVESLKLLNPNYGFVELIETDEHPHPWYKVSYGGAAIKLG